MRTADRLLCLLGLATAATGVLVVLDAASRALPCWLALFGCRG